MSGRKASKPPEDGKQLCWPTILDLAVPADYAGICACPESTVDSAIVSLESTCGTKLADYYRDLGRDETRTLRSKLHFASAVLIDQTAAVQREMCEQLRQLHLEDPRFPSLATIYRCVSPLKVWLHRRCGKGHSIRLKDLRADKRPLLLLTNENIEAIVDECKTFRKFAREYRPRRDRKTGRPADQGNAPAPGTQTTETSPKPPVVLSCRPEPSTEPSPSETLILVRGQMTRNTQRTLANALHGQAEVVVLTGRFALDANDMLNRALKAASECPGNGKSSQHKKRHKNGKNA